MSRCLDSRPDQSELRALYRRDPQAFRREVERSARRHRAEDFAAIRRRLSALLRRALRPGVSSGLPAWLARSSR